MVRAATYRRLQGPRRCVCSRVDCVTPPPLLRPWLRTHDRAAMRRRLRKHMHVCSCRRMHMPSRAHAHARTRTRLHARTGRPVPEAPAHARRLVLRVPGGVGIAGNGPVDARLHADCVEAFIASRMHKCHGCRRPIRGGQVIASSSRSWHEECFLCAACRRPLQLDFVELQGEPYHAACVRPVGRA